MYLRVIAILCVLVGQAFAERVELEVLPVDTDPQITTNLAAHYVAVDTDRDQVNRLFVFFPGTFATPSAYNLIVNTAADLGLHSIGLTYPNDEPVNQLCGNGMADLDCYGDVRLEILFGENESTLVNVNRPNSAENRIIKLLSYLEQNRPDENWGQYLDDTGGLRWEKIVVSGHSQGGGHAGILGRYKPVARSIMFAAMDYNGALQQPANWINDPTSTPNATPPERFYGFSHVADQAVNILRLRDQVWPAYGIDALGPLISVDAFNPPYNSTHTLTTTAECENAHGCIVADIRTPIVNGESVYKPVWEYLLSGLNDSFGLGSVTFERSGKPVARPYLGFSGKLYRLVINGSGFIEGSEILVNGVPVGTERISNELLKARLPGGPIGTPGRNTIQIRLPDGTLSGKLTY